MDLYSHCCFYGLSFLALYFYMFWSFDLWTQKKTKEEENCWLCFSQFCGHRSLVIFQVLPLIDWTLAKKSDLVMIRVLLFEVIWAIWDPLTVCVSVLIQFLVMRLCFSFSPFRAQERHISHSSRQRPTVIYFSFLWALTSSLTLNSESSSGLPFSAAPWLCVPVALQEVCTCSRLRVQQTCSFGPAHSFVYLSYFCSRWRPVLFLSLFSSL